LLAEEDGFVAEGGGGDVGDVEDGVVHGDASCNGSALAADERVAGVGEVARETVCVAEGQEGQACGAGGAEGGVVAGGFSGGEVAEGDDAGFEAEDGLEGGGFFLGGE
jgi:hypothetical protein